MHNFLMCLWLAGKSSYQVARTDRVDEKITKQRDDASIEGNVPVFQGESTGYD